MNGHIKRCSQDYTCKYLAFLSKTKDYVSILHENKSKYNSNIIQRAALGKTNAMLYQNLDEKGSVF